ncbi:MAG: type I DNA topoisomerase [Ignavibacteria bacterium]|nr:type I DNA topoisomerase [Ignavibacteria bacterium]
MARKKTEDAPAKKTTPKRTRKKTQVVADATSAVTNGRALIIVESPAKAKTINKYLGKEYHVEASVGHIKNLPKSKIGVDIEGGFVPEYETIKGKDDVISRLRSHASKARAVYLATDPDREGEAIAWHIAREIEDQNKNIFRVMFHEITERGITQAMEQPTRIDEHLVNSQQARRVMDRLVGYKVSPFVWKTVFYGLSAGRVQSVAVRLICEREEEINSFIPEEYWSIVGEFLIKGKEPFFAKLFKVAGDDPVIGDATTAEGYVSEISRQSFVIADVQTKPVKRNPSPPFITSTLQQEAARRLRFHAKRTMMLAQKLYEGVDLGEDGRVGLITYMRTDSTRLSEDAVREVREFIYENYGKGYLPHEARLFKKGKSSQDAHEAIRPTSSKFSPKHVKKYLDKEMFQLYELIWNRFVACQMSPAVFDQVTVDVSGGEYLFRATDSIPKFRGFLQVYDDVAEENDIKNDEDPVSRLPVGLRSGEEAALTNLVPNQHFTKPPARFSESSLVKELESRGIGRPSTYALIVDTIQARKYVEQRERRLYATELGKAVNRILVNNFPDLFNVEFTARMEEELDTIASGKRSYELVMEDFYVPFMKSVEGVDKNAAAIKKSLQEPTDEVCELCGKPVIIKWGRNGRFMACTGYPSCKNTKPLPEEQELTKHVVGMKCDLCGGDMVVKGGRFGAFLGCSNYPSCRNTKPISIGMKCPKCKDGDVIERKTKRKRVFYGCSRYPDCDFASWDKPVIQPCDTCGNPYMVEKYTQTRGEFLSCPACKAEVAKEEVAEKVD